MKIFRECFPEGIRAVVKKDSYEIPAIFNLIAKTGNIAEEMMYNTFNMGIGMVVAVDEKDVDATIKAMKEAGDEAFVVGLCRSRRKRSYFMLRVAVLVSGGGTNLQAIIDAVENGTITNTELVGVISNNKNAYALTRSRESSDPGTVRFAEGF